jgi:hypothetical protein
MGGRRVHRPDIVRAAAGYDSLPVAVYNVVAVRAETSAS